MSRTRIPAKAFCLLLLALCLFTNNSSSAEAPPPQDSLWSQQWNMKNTATPGIDVGLLGAWEFTTGTPNQGKVAVVGAAAYAAHPDFIPASGSNRIDPEGYHSPEGTIIAGILAAEANNGGATKRGIAGMNQACSVLTYETYNSTKIEAAVTAGADVILLFKVSGDPDDVSGEAISYAYKHDAVLIAATGNDSGQHSYYPASFDGVIGVGGVKHDGGHALRHSSYGPMVDLVAPDGDTNVADVHWLTSLIPTDGYAKVFATQYASAHVAGAASLLRGVYPELVNDDIANVLKLSAHDIPPIGRDDETGYGLVKADSAFRLLQSPNTLRHFTGTSAPSVYSVSGQYACPFYDAEGLANAIYHVKKYEIRAEVAFPTPITISPVHGDVETQRPGSAPVRQTSESDTRTLCRAR